MSVSAAGVLLIVYEYDGFSPRIGVSPGDHGCGCQKPCVILNSFIVIACTYNSRGNVLLALDSFVNENDIS